jgi:hypothetical protein
MLTVDNGNDVISRIWSIYFNNLCIFWKNLNCWCCCRRFVVIVAHKPCKLNLKQLLLYQPQTTPPTARHGLSPISGAVGWLVQWGQGAQSSRSNLLGVGPLRPGSFASRVLCVPGSMRPGFYASRVLCVPGSMCPRPSELQNQKIFCTGFQLSWVRGTQAKSCRVPLKLLPIRWIPSACID